MSLGIEIEPLTRETYLELEKQLQYLRLRIMRVAAEGAQKAGHPAITREDIDDALVQFVEHVSACNIDSDRSTGNVPQDAYIYLEKRLHKLRLLLIRWAAKLSRQTTGDTKHAAEILPIHIAEAWRTEGKGLLKSVIAADEAGVL